jgi:tRNA nucleotidyltransferase/poly(A) polymerase
VRLEARLGFGFEPQTEVWAREAAASGVFDLLSRDRLVAELELLVEEESDLAAMWWRLEDLGVLPALGFEPAPDAPELLAGVRGAVLDFRSLYDRQYPVSTFAALVRAAMLEQPRGRRSRLLERLKTDSGVEAELDRLEELPTLLEMPELPPHRVNSALESLPPEALVVLLHGAGADCATRVHGHLTEQRGLRLNVDGEALLRRGFAPGPEIGRALRATRDARLDGRIGPEDEVAFAVQMIRAGGNE